MTADVRPTDTTAPLDAVPPQRPTDVPASAQVAGAGPAENKKALAATRAERETEVNIDKVRPRLDGVKPPPAVDQEFRALLPALTPDQRAGLEKSILAEGVLSPLVVWDEEGLLLDGHNRLEIALREGIPFPTRTVKLASREAAVEWIFAHQRDRRNLTPDQLALVMGRHYNARKLPLGGDKRTQKASSQKGNEVSGPGATAKKLADEYGVKFKAVVAAGKFAAAVETLRVVDPDIEQKVVTGKGPTRKAVIAAAEADPEEAKAILSGETKPEPKTHRLKESKETLADRRGFKRLPLREATERAEAAAMMLETALEGLEDINPDRLNGERHAFAERFCKAAHSLNRMAKTWKGESK